MLNREIAFSQATDPGWTPIFLLFAGVVVESGGLLSHASCIEVTIESTAELVEPRPEPVLTA